MNRTAEYAVSCWFPSIYETVSKDFISTPKVLGLSRTFYDQNSVILAYIKININVGTKIYHRF